MVAIQAARPSRPEALPAKAAGAEELADWLEELLAAEWVVCRKGMAWPLGVRAYIDMDAQFVSTRQLKTKYNSIILWEWQRYVILKPGVCRSMRMKHA